jgi:hypothetical protein
MLIAGRVGMQVRQPLAGQFTVSGQHRAGDRATPGSQAARPAEKAGGGCGRVTRATVDRNSSLAPFIFVDR